VKNRRFTFPLLLLPVLLLLQTNQAARAGSATWSASPSTSDWNTATNWMPNTIPNGSGDIATFDLSNTTSVSLSAVTTIDGIVFNATASAFTITALAGETLTFNGAGVTNNSGKAQSFVADINDNAMFGTISFLSNATAGGMTFFTARGSAFSEGGQIEFLGDASAGNGVFINEGAPPNTSFGNGRTTFSGTSSAANSMFTNESGGGTTEFLDSSSAGDGIFTVEGSSGGAGGGMMTFNDTSTADNGTFVVIGSSDTATSIGPKVEFFDFSTADHATFTVEGATISGGAGGLVSFFDKSTALDAIFIVNGSDVTGAAGGEVDFSSNNSTTADATVIVNGGIGEGGFCVIDGPGAGGTPRIEIFGNGTLLLTGITRAKINVGSIEGDGSVQLTQRSVLVTGGNNLSTVFSGVIQDLGPLQQGTLEKAGTGTLTLTGVNTYLGGTTLDSGALVVSNATGSGTGTGAVTVSAGTLGGKGIISGVVTIGTGSGGGAFLAPAFGSRTQVTLTLQSSLTLQSDATYTCTLKANKNKARTDLVIANGVTINSAALAITGTTQGRMKRGTVLTVISNTSANPISGTFSNLADGAIITVNGNNLQASYEGGDGNDLMLTVVP
jgi:autotransporter-associated beta strand protein